MIFSTAPAKIILLGEHAVVFGQPAIAIPVSHLRATASVSKNDPGSGLQIIANDLGITVAIPGDEQSRNHPFGIIALQVLAMLEGSIPDLTISLNSAIPVASGLGSGAAISTVIARSLIAALNATIDNEQLNRIVYEAEKIHHGIPSGIDNTVIVYERPVYFQRGSEVTFLEPGGQFHFIIADTGVKALTRDAVKDVRMLHEKSPGKIQLLFDGIGDLVNLARVALESNDPVQLGELMNRNHTLLQELTISSPELDRLVSIARNAGALGAKLSGAGRGGNIIALTSEHDLLPVRSALTASGAAHVYETLLERKLPC